MIDAQQIISKYQLHSHPEGGYFTETYRSTELIPAGSLPGRFKGSRSFSTAIYFLLEGKQFSAFHRIKSDECWHFYSGIGLHIYILYPDRSGETFKLGDELHSGYSHQHVVPAGCWFASKPVHENGFSFVGCTVAPGFDFADFEMAEKEKLLNQYPQYKEWIDRLA
jgi:predicted cupin superfamily sugar epimerase